MYKVKADPVRNLVTIAFSGHVEPKELASGRAVVVAALEQVKPGFRLFTDLSALDSMEYACAPEIQAIMDLFRKKGVAEVVRVVPDPHKDIGFTVMSYFHYGKKVPVLTFETREEALQKLAE